MGVEEVRQIDEWLESGVIKGQGLGLEQTDPELVIEIVEAEVVEETGQSLEKQMKRAGSWSLKDAKNHLIKICGYQDSDVTRENAEEMVTAVTGLELIAWKKVLAKIPTAKVHAEGVQMTEKARRAVLQSGVGEGNGSILKLTGSV